MEHNQEGLALDLDILNNSLEISLHAMFGSSNPETMRVVANIGAMKVVALIDIGSTHNFLDPRVLNKIRLRVDKSIKVQVKVANGELVGSEWKVGQVPLSIQGTAFKNRGIHVGIGWL